jgi:hypothetical protein
MKLYEPHTRINLPYEANTTLQTQKPEKKYATAWDPDATHPHADTVVLAKLL